MRMRRRPGEVRDAIFRVLEERPTGSTLKEIATGVTQLIGDVAPSSIRSYLQLNTPTLFARMERAQYVLNAFDGPLTPPPATRAHEADEFGFGRAKLHLGDCIAWIDAQPAQTIHAVVTDPPYGLVEYSDIEQAKLREGKSGVWRIPPSFDGAKRAPLPRFTVLKATDLAASVHAPDDATSKP